MVAETGYSQFFGQKYCPNIPGQVPFKQWIAEKRKQSKGQKQVTEHPFHSSGGVLPSQQPSMTLADQQPEVAHSQKLSVLPAITQQLPVPPRPSSIPFPLRLPTVPAPTRLPTVQVLSTVPVPSRLPTVRVLPTVPVPSTIHVLPNYAVQQQQQHKNHP